MVGIKSFSLSLSLLFCLSLYLALSLSICMSLSLTLSLSFCLSIISYYVPLILSVSYFVPLILSISYSVSLILSVSVSVSCSQYFCLRIRLLLSIFLSLSLSPSSDFVSVSVSFLCICLLPLYLSPSSVSVSPLFLCLLPQSLYLSYLSVSIYIFPLSLCLFRQNCSNVTLFSHLLSYIILFVFSDLINGSEYGNYAILVPSQGTLQVLGNHLDMPSFCRLRLNQDISPPVSYLWGGTIAV